MSKRKLFNQLSSYDSGLTKTPYTISGLLGVIINGEQVVEVPTRNSYFYVRLRDSTDELIQAFNDKVAPVYDLPVILTYKNGRYVITGRDIDRYGDWGGHSAYLPRHGSTHSFVDSGGGTDIVWVYGKQFMPYLAQPSGSGGSAGVILNGNTFLKSDGTWRYDGQTGSASLLSYKPTGTDNARMVLVYQDMQNGVYGYSAGSEFSASITGTSLIVPYIPTLSNANYNPIAAVRLVSGTSKILWNNLYDVRQFFRMQPTGTQSILGIYDESIYRGDASAFNFVGDNVVATVTSGTARIFVTGSRGMNIYDEGSFLGTFSELDFAGSNIVASVSGTRVRVYVTGSVGGGVSTGSSTALNYEDVSGQFISGSYVTHFTLTGTATLGTDRLYYNGLRQQRPTHYTLDGDGRGFTTIFTGTYDDVLIMDYGIIGSTSTGTGGGGGGQGSDVDLTTYSGIKGWWKAQAGVMLTGTTNKDVGTWEDQSGNGFHATALSFARPTFWNNPRGYDGVLFDGQSDYMTTSCVPATGTHARTLLAVLLGGDEPPSSYNYSHIMMYGTQDTSKAYGLLVDAQGYHNLGAHFWVNYQLGAASIGMGKCVFVSTYDGSVNRLYWNGSILIATTIALNTGATEGLVFGSRIGPMWEGGRILVGEFAAWDRALSESEITTLSTDLMAKYGIF